MSINKEVTNALKDIGIPVSFQTSKNEKYPYITFFSHIWIGGGHYILMIMKP